MSQDPLPALSTKATSIKVGSRYEHYKGFPYIVLSVGRHSETLEELVVYQAQYGENDVWIRPVAMFVENVIVDGNPCPRFKLIN